MIKVKPRNNLMAGSDFDTTLELALFCFYVWLAGIACRYIKVSPLLGQIIIGTIVGPRVANMVPLPEGFTTAGQIGIALTMIESGMHIRIQDCYVVGKQAIMVAFFGCLAPFLTTMAIMKFFFQATTLSSIASGMVMVPTSIGISMQLLTESKQRDKPAGQLIVVSAFLDDLLAILMLSGAMEWSTGNLDWLMILLRTIFSISLVACCGLVANKTDYILSHLGGWSNTIQESRLSKSLSKRISWKSEPETEPKHFETKDAIRLLILFIGAIGLSTLSNTFGSYLLGCFSAGLAFSQIDSGKRIWKHQVKRIHGWLIRFFFAATVGFSIPLSDVLSWEYCWKGLIIAMLAGVGGKIVCGFWAKENPWVVGTAMMGRGEFSFLMAQTFLQLKRSDKHLLDSVQYNILIWALMITCVVAPLTFNISIMNIKKERERERVFKIKISGSKHHGMLEDIQDTLEEMKISIESMNSSYRESEVDLVIEAKGKACPDSVKSCIVEAIGDNSQIVEIISLTQKPMDQL